jgi:WD40 repeat protein
LHLLDTGNEPFDKVGLAISPDGQLVAGGIFVVVNSSGHGATRIWDSVTGKERFSWDISRTALALAFSPDGKRLVAADGEMRLHFFSLDGGMDEVVQTEHSIVSVAFSSDGKLLATGDSSGQVSLWDVEAKKVLSRISLVQGSDVTGWPILIAASLVWLVLWSYACRMQRQSPRTDAEVV